MKQTVRSVQAIFLAIALLLFSGTLAPAQPKIAVDKSSIDFGTTYNGAVRKARIVVKNVGKDTLKILGVQTSCGCTTVKQPKQALKPGESDTIEVEFNSTGFRGKITKHVQIQTNDPASSLTDVTLTTDVVDELEPINRASVLWLGSVPVGKEVQQTVAFKNVSGKPITIRGVKTSSPSLSVEVGQKTVMPSDSVVVTIKVSIQKTEYFNEQFYLETDSKRQSQVPMRVTFIGVKPS